MKKLLILLLFLFIVAAIALNGQDNCKHLTGSDYDRCHFSQVRGK